MIQTFKEAVADFELRPSVVSLNGLKLNTIFPPREGKCFGVLAQFVTHIVWISHHVTFRGAEKGGRDRRWRRGAVWADNKLKQRGRKSREKGEIKREGAWCEACLMHSERLWRARLRAHKNTQNGAQRGVTWGKREQIPSHVFIFSELQCSSRGWIRTSRSPFGASLVNFCSRGGRRARKVEEIEERENGEITGNDETAELWGKTAESARAPRLQGWPPRAHRSQADEPLNEKHKKLRWRWNKIF